MPAVSAGDVGEALSVVRPSVDAATLKAYDDFSAKFGTRC